MRIALPGNAAFTRYWIAETLLSLGQEIFLVAVGWQVYDLTHDPLALGLIGLAEAVPYIATSLYAGHVADRHHRARIFALCMLAQGAVAALLCWGTFHGEVSRDLILGLSVLLGVAFFARQFWGWLSDRVGGLRTILYGSAAQTAAIERGENALGPAKFGIIQCCLFHMPVEMQSFTV
mgnify:CR=1 FL=1